MRIKERITYINSLVAKIGFIHTASYLIQRKLRSKGALVKVHVPGLNHTIFLRNKTYDIHIFYQIFVKEDLQFEYKDSVKTILDCGANIGLATLYYQKKFPQAKIISIEPEKRNYNLLIKNTEGYPNISTLENGVYGSDCGLEVVDIGEGEASYRTMGVNENQKVLQTISCRSINSLIDEFELNKVDILKMDIEGSEKECLFSPKIEWLSKTRYFLVEIHENIYPGLKKEILKIIPPTSKIFNRGEYTIIVNNLTK